MEDPTSIRLSQASKKRLDDRGRKGETHNDIVNKLLDQADPPKTIHETLSRLDEEFERLRMMRNEANAKALADKLPDTDPVSLDLRRADNFIEGLRERLRRWPW